MSLTMYYYAMALGNGEIFQSENARKDFSLTRAMATQKKKHKRK